MILPWSAALLLTTFRTNKSKRVLITLRILNTFEYRHFKESCLNCPGMSLAQGLVSFTATGSRHEQPCVDMFFIVKNQPKETHSLRLSEGDSGERSNETEVKQSGPFAVEQVRCFIMFFFHLFLAWKECYSFGIMWFFLFGRWDYIENSLRL